MFEQKQCIIWFGLGVDNPFEKTNLNGKYEFSATPTTLHFFYFRFIILDYCNIMSVIYM